MNYYSLRIDIFLCIASENISHIINSNLCMKYSCCFNLQQLYHLIHVQRGSECWANAFYYICISCRVYHDGKWKTFFLTQGWKLPPKVTEDDDLELVGPEVKAEDIKEHQRRTLEVARERLLALEKNVERRYLKPPFTKL